MTDFLTRIAERTLGVAPVAQPIIPPLFAPGPTIPASVPASLESNEMQETPSPARQAHPSSTQTVPQPPTARIGEESNSASMQPSPRRIGTPMHAQTGQPVFLQQQAQVTHGADTRTVPESRTPASPTQYFLHQTSIRSNLMNESVSPAPMASAPPSLLEEEKEITATSARDISANQQPIRTLVDAQATLPKMYAHQLVTPPEEYDGEKRTAGPPTQLSSTPSGSVHIENTPLTSEAHIASPQALPQEVTEIREGQSVVSEQQSIYSPSKETIGEASHRQGQAVAPTVREQSLLVPQKPDRSDWQDQQSVADQRTKELTASYEEEIIGGARASLGGINQGRANQGGASHAVTTRGQRMARSEKQASTDVSEPSAMIPTVHVTIGRIDVRAVTPSEPSTRAKPTRAAPRISLEDYARQNKQGGR